LFFVTGLHLEENTQLMSNIILSAFSGRRDRLYWFNLSLHF